MTPDETVNSSELIAELQDVIDGVLAVQIGEQFYGPDHVQMVQSLKLLATSHEKLGDHQKAVELRHRADAIAARAKKA